MFHQTHQSVKKMIQPIYQKAKSRSCCQIVFRITAKKMILIVWRFQNTRSWDELTLREITTLWIHLVSFYLQVYTVALTCRVGLGAVNIFSSAIKPCHNKPTGRQAGRPPGAKNKSKSLSLNSVIDQAVPVEHKNDNQDKAIPEVDANATGFYTDLDVRYLFILQAYTYTAFRNYLQLCKTDQ